MERAVEPHVGTVQLRSRTLVVVENVGAGKPVADMLKVPAVPNVKVVVASLVIAGDRSTFNVNVWVATIPNPLFAVMASV